MTEDKTLPHKGMADEALALVEALWAVSGSRLVLDRMRWLLGRMRANMPSAATAEKMRQRRREAPKKRPQKGGRKADPDKAIATKEMIDEALTLAEALTAPPPVDGDPRPDRLRWILARARASLPDKATREAYAGRHREVRRQQSLEKKIERHKRGLLKRGHPSGPQGDPVSDEPTPPKGPRGRPPRDDKTPRPLFTKELADEALLIVERLVLLGADRTLCERLVFILGRARSRAYTPESAARAQLYNLNRQEERKRARRRQKAAEARESPTT
jgi:hypothetical protein